MSPAQKIGDFFVSIGALSSDEVEQILERQRQLKAQGDDDVFWYDRDGAGPHR